MDLLAAGFKVRYGSRESICGSVWTPSLAAWKWTLSSAFFVCRQEIRVSGYSGAVQRDGGACGR